MKLVRPIKLVVFGLLLVVFSSQLLASDGVVSFARGLATVNGVQAKAGMPVSSGDRVETKSNGTVMLVMKDKSTMLVKKDSGIRIKDYAYDKARPAKGRTVISLLTGSLRYISGLINKARPGTAKISTVVATLGIRGSDTTVTYNREDGTIAAQFDRGTGTLTIFASDGTTPVASVPIPTGQSGSGQSGSSNVAVVVATPDQVTAAVNKAGRSSANAASIKTATKTLGTVGKLVAIAILNTQDNVPASEGVAGVLGNAAGTGVVGEAGRALTVANALEPDAAGDNTQQAVKQVAAATNGDTKAIAATVAKSVETVAGTGNAAVNEVIGAGAAATAEVTGGSADAVKQVVSSGADAAATENVTLDATDFAEIASSAAKNAGESGTSTSGIADGVVGGAADAGVQVDQQQIDNSVQQGASQGANEAESQGSKASAKKSDDEDATDDSTTDDSTSDDSTSDDSTNTDGTNTDGGDSATTTSTDLVGSIGGGSN